MLPSDREARGSYGGPRTGDPVFAQFVFDSCNVFRYVNLGDPESLGLVRPQGLPTATRKSKNVYISHVFRSNTSPKSILWNFRLCST